MAEFLLPNSCLCDYEYVHHCIKLEKDVLLCLLHINEVPRPLLRTAEDDIKDIEIKVDDLLSREPGDALTHATVSVLIDIIHGEIDRLLVNSSHIQPKGLLQSVKGKNDLLFIPLFFEIIILFFFPFTALCSMLGCIETTDLTMALDNIVFTCNNSTRGSNRAEIVGEDGPYSMVVLPGQNRLRTNCVELVTAIRKLINAYTCAFRVNFALPLAPGCVKVYESSGVLDCVGFRVGALHRLEPSWNFDTYEVRIDLLHGVTSVGRSQVVFGTASSRSAAFFPNRIVFDEVISFSSVAICTLPRESRLVLTVYGRRKVAEGDPGNGSEAEHVELGWTAQNFFTYGDPNWTLVQGATAFSLN
jgi:phosphatidylinositol-4-phosphate 3-kinase